MISRSEMLTRPRTSFPPTANPAVTSRLCAGPASYLDWLLSLKRESIVRVRTHVGFTMPPAMVTNDTPCYVFVGKLKFHRRHGWQVMRQSSCVYRMRLRLVRDETETFT